jgi:polyisoprenoid-binding protein YceI
MTGPTRFATFSVLAALALPSAAQQQYAIQPGGEQKMELRVTKTGLYSGKVHVFVFPAYRGSLRYDAAQPAASEVLLTLDAGGIKLTDDWLNEGDFKEVQRYALEEMLEAKKYPQVTFVSSEIVPMDATHYKVGGALTIRGRSKPVVVNVTLEPAAGEALRFVGEAVVKLTDFGLKPPKALLGLIGTKDEMQFSFSLNAQPE